MSDLVGTHFVGFLTHRLKCKAGIVYALHLKESPRPSTKGYKKPLSKRLLFEQHRNVAHLFYIVVWRTPTSIGQDAASVGHCPQTILKMSRLQILGEGEGR